MSRNYKIVGGGIIILLLLFFGGVAITHNPPNDPAAADPGPACNTTKIVDKAVEKMGYTKSQFTVGHVDPNLPGAQSNRSGAFSGKPLVTRSDLDEFLASNDKGAVEARKLIGDKDVTWTPVQFLVPVTYHGMKILVNGRTVAGGEVHVPKGDVIWVAISKSTCKVVALVRGACGNFSPHFPTPQCVSHCGTPTCQHSCGGCESNCTPPPKCKPPYVPYEGRCVKPGGHNDGHTTDPVNTHPQGTTPGAPHSPPPSPTRPPGDPNGGSGDGGADPPTGSTDDSDSGQTTGPDPGGNPTNCPLVAPDCG